MRATFHPYLPNGPAGDPLLRVDLPDEGHSVMLDLGDLHRLSPRKLLRVDRVVVTHTHIDHFIGFDTLLRACLGRERPLTLTGPAGFLDQVAGRLAGYSWNLIENYPVCLIAEEVDGDVVRAARHRGVGRMQREPLGERPFTGTIHEHRAYTIQVVPLDHGIPVLGVLLRESEHLAVNRDRVERLGLRPGPWLAELKNAVRRCRPHDTPVEAETATGGRRTMTVAELEDALLTRTAGQRLAYVTDLAGSEANRQQVVELANGVDLLVCEATFLDADRQLAAERRHLTARQAGEWARAAEARKLAPFHFSPRYAGRAEELWDEAARAFGGPVERLPVGPERTEDDGCGP